MELLMATQPISGVYETYSSGCVMQQSIIMLLYLSIFALIAAGLAFIPSNIAGKKGWSRAGFWWFGFAALIPAIIVACCIQNRKM